MHCPPGVQYCQQICEIAKWDDARCSVREENAHVHVGEANAFIVLNLKIQPL